MLSKLLEENTRLIVTTSIGLVTVSAGLVYFYKKYLDEQQPTEWRKVGELHDLVCFPIKSCGPVRVKEFECSIIGLQHGFMRDRIFMITKLDGRFITARQYPKMVKIQPKFEGIDDTVMTLSAPSMMDTKVDLKRLLDVPNGEGTIWGQKVKIIDCGDEAAKWFSKYILNEDSGLRLSYYPLDHPTRAVNDGKMFRNVTKDDTGSYQDETSFMLMNEASIADLNTRIKEPVTTLQFRPNFVVKGPSSFEEDKWKWIKIGDAIFRNVRPCTRCVFTNINPETGISNKEAQPLKTLREYRMLPNCGKSPVMGIHLGVRRKGAVRLGDPIFVEA